MCWNVSLFVVSVLHRGEELPTKRRKRKKNDKKRKKKKKKKEESEGEKRKVESRKL